MTTKLNTIIGATSIIFGGMIYVLWRDQNLLMFSWFDMMGLTPIVISLRHIANPISSFIPDWFYFSLPNAMWAFAGILLFCGICRDSPIARMFWTFVFITISIGSEIAQLSGDIPGTYDPTDMELMVICVSFAVFIGNSQITKEANDEKPV